MAVGTMRSWRWREAQVDGAAYYASPGSVISTAASESDVRYRLPLLATDGPVADDGSWCQKRGWCSAVLAALLAGAFLGVAIGWAVGSGSPTLPDSCFNPDSCGGPEPCKRLTLFGRNVWVYQPRSARFSPLQQLPVVVVLHGSYGCALQMAKVSGFQEVAEEAQFLVAYPEMMTTGSRDWAYNDPNEVAFFSAMIEMLSYEFMIDQREVFVCGFSAGGTMALFLQNNYPGLYYAAAAVDAGIAYADQWNNRSSGRPVAVIWNHNDRYLQNHYGRESFKKTVKFLLRDPARDGPSTVRTLPAEGQGVLYAEQLHWDAWRHRPPVMVVSWASAEPTHAWPSPATIPGCFDTARMVWKFFVGTRSHWGGVVPMATDADVEPASSGSEGAA